MCLGGDFTSRGFLHSSLYVLIENLICSGFQTRSASDAVLHVIAATSGYPTVRHLVVDTSDYIIDFICQQLRHLDLNPHVPSVLAAMLSYIRAAHNILLLLEDPEVVEIVKGDIFREIFYSEEGHQQLLGHVVVSILQEAMGGCPSSVSEIT